MYLSENERNFFDEGIILSANKLILSKVRVDDEDYEDECKFSADLYATIDEENENQGYLHLRVYDRTKEELDPTIVYENKKILEAILKFAQEGDEDDYRFIFKKKGGAKIIFSDGEKKEINTPSDLNGVSLILATKIFFIDVIRISLESDNCNYSLEG